MQEKENSPDIFTFLCFKQLMELFFYPELNAPAVCPFSELGRSVFLLFLTVDSTSARLWTHCSIQ